MRKFLRVSLLLLSGLITLMSFQNCGKGFEAIGDAASLSSSSTGGSLTGLPAGLSGNGKIFKRDPFTDAKLTAADFTMDFSSFTSTAQLSHMLDVNHFSNSVVDLGQDDAFPGMIPTPRSSLSYTPSQPQFQHVNSYYHLDKLISELVSVQQFSITRPALKVNPHCTAGASALNNAYYSPSENLLCMGKSNPNNLSIWAADDADVLVHEFGHYLNHYYSSDEIMGSTWETGAMDEGLADVWAYRQNEGIHISEWYGRAIYAAAGQLIEPYTGLRDLTTVPQYPQQLMAEVHDDSTYISTVFYTLLKAHPELTKAQFSLLIKRVLESLQMGDGFGAAIRTLRTEVAKVGITAAEVDAALTARGLYRKDDLAGVAVEGTPVVMDNHAFTGISVGGNCSGTLDAGETVVVYVDLKNSGTTDLGQMYAKLTTNAAPAAIEILPGGEIGSFYRLLTTQSYLQDEIKTQTKLGSRYVQRLLYSSFVIKAGATATGPYTFTMALSGMNSIDTTPVKKTVTFTLNVGNGTTMAGKCPGTKETDVFP